MSIFGYLGGANGGINSPSFNPAADNSGTKFADAFMRGRTLDIDLLAKGLGKLSVSNQAMASQLFAELTPQFKQLSPSDQGTFERLFQTEIGNATPDKGRAAQPGVSETTAIKTQYGTFKVSDEGTLTPDKFRSQPIGTPEFKLWKDVHDGLIRNKDPEMGTPKAENAAARWVFYSEGRISVDQIAALNGILGGSAQTEKALAEYSGQGIPLNVTFELPQHAPLRYFTEYKSAQQRLEAVLDIQSRNAANPTTTADQLRVTSAIVQNARTGVDIAWQRFESSKSVAGRAGLEFQYQNSDVVRDANATEIANSETNKLLAIAFAGPAIGAGLALLPEALALYRGGQAIKAGFTALAGAEQVTGGLNTLRTGGESQTGITGGLINAATGTRAGDTISLVIQLAPEIYGVVALGKSAMATYPSKAQALKAADALDDVAFKTGQIKERAPVGTERQVLQTPEVKAQLATEATRKATADAAEAEAKAIEIVVTGRVKSPKAIQSLAEIVAKRKALATEFYKQQGFPDYKIASHLDGIDFTKPVEVITLKPPQRLVQHQVPGGPQGNYYSITGTSPEKLGISAKAQTKSGDIVNREATIYNVVDEVKVLRSKAASVTDTWSLPGKMIKTEGGGTQFFTTNALAFKAIK